MEPLTQREDRYRIENQNRRREDLSKRRSDQYLALLAASLIGATIGYGLGRIVGYATGASSAPNELSVFTAGFATLGAIVSALPPITSIRSINRELSGLEANLTADASAPQRPSVTPPIEEPRVREYA